MAASAWRVEARAPGRVNLIGEHTDYTGGFVLPCAIGYETRVVGSRRDDRRVTVRSRGATCACELDALSEVAAHDWTDYVRGVLAELAAAGVPLVGADLVVDGTLPMNVGLSSSASFEASLARALLALAEAATLEGERLAELLRSAESEYAGMRCGIMDQFVVLHARAGHALFLDTRDLTFAQVRIPASLAIVVCDSRTTHDLVADGAFNERRRECEEAFARLRTRHPELHDLRDVTLALLAASRDLLPSPLFERCRHVVSENARVVAAVAALRAGAFAELGAAMHASHESLRTDFAVSRPEVDTLVRLAGALPGVHGARMTGGGFGGCVVAVVDAEHAAEFRARIVPAYERATGLVAALYDGTPVDGASVTHG